MLLVTHPVFLEHDPGPGHPERPARLRAVLDLLTAQAPRCATWHRAPREATRRELLLAHGEGHVDGILAFRDRPGWAGDETPLSERSVEAALRAAGGAIEAVDAVFAAPRDRSPASSRRAFLLARPPGHHAERDRAMGFCIFNSIAVAAAHAIASGRARRVLIVDWDVHHGNGTQEIFWSRSDVLVVSTHQWPLYPGSGHASERGGGEGEGFTVNVPLPAGCGDAEYLDVFEGVLRPRAADFEPDLVLVSAGFDAHAGDPLAAMRVTERGFAALAGVVAEIADRHAGGRLVACLEGGYVPEDLARSALACVEAWSAGDVPARAAT